MRIASTVALLLAWASLASADEVRLATPATAQPEAKWPRVGVLFHGASMQDLAGEVPASPYARALVDGLREKGWIDGRNVRIVWRSCEGRRERVSERVDELVRLPVDVLVASGNDIAAEAVRRKPGLPVVLGTSDYPVESGLVASYTDPGGSITGLTNWVGRFLNSRRLALMKEAVPRLSKVAVLGHRGRWEKEPFWQETQAAADALGIEIFKVGFGEAIYMAGSREEQARTMDRAMRSGADGILVLDEPFAYDRSFLVHLGELAVKHRVPVMHSVAAAADAGALLTYAPDIADNFRRAGHFVDKILKGANPAELPIEQPTKLDLVVDLKAAKAIGLSVPQSILTQASRIVE